ncbi:hypothetical protein [Methanobrevibacter oralis]|nr:hypothetical protein [Methanobrevibacter oralis]
MILIGIINDNYENGATHGIVLSIIVDAIYIIFYNKNYKIL